MKQRRDHSTGDRGGRLPSLTHTPALPLALPIQPTHPAPALQSRCTSIPCCLNPAPSPKLPHSVTQQLPPL